MTTLHQTNGPRRTLSLFDAVCIIVGTIIGAGIFESAPNVARSAGNPYTLIGLWLFGGFLTVVGALCFAELTTRFSEVAGGDYGYLKLAYGREVAFMFAWATFWIIRPGNVGAMALTFATYFQQLVSIQVGEWGISKAWYALAAVAVLSLTNLIGLKQGKILQNVLTLAKVLGLLAIVVLGLLPGNSDLPTTQDSLQTEWSDWLLAMVFIMFAFGGWNDLSFIANEISHPERNLFRALVVGAVGVTLIYVLVNLAFVNRLGTIGVAQSPAVATDVIVRALGPENSFAAKGAQIVAALICISCLGAINGIIITSPRIYYAAGRDFQLIRSLGHWNESRNQPWTAIAAQAVVTAGLFLLCFQHENPFKVIVVATAPFFWGFLGLVAVALIMLRFKRPQPESSSIYRVPLFPLEPMLLAGACFAMAYSSTRYLVSEGYWLTGSVVFSVMLTGIILGFVLRNSTKS
jgi:amino acid transporter